MPGSSGGQTSSLSQNTAQNSSQNSNFGQSQNGTTSASPWGPFTDFITGGQPGPNGQPGTPGVLPNLAAAFNNSAWSPAASNATNDYTNDVTRRDAIMRGSQFENVGAGMNLGNYDAHITPASMITPTNVGPVAARAAQGSLDPTSTLSSFLTGANTNPWVAQQQQGITDQLTRNMLENVMPNIRSGAVMAGQYGGNRQGLAEGTAMSRLNTDLAPTLAGLGSSAYESGQNRELATAMGLNQQATDVATGNANRTLAADTTNVGTQLGNNQQTMANAAQTVGNRLSALNYTAGANALDNQNYTDLMNSVMAPSNYDWNNLARFSSIFQPMMGMYPQTSTSANASGNSSSNSTMQGTSFGTQFTPTSSNPLGMGLGSLLSLGSLAGGLGWKPFGAGGAGAAGGIVDPWMGVAGDPWSSLASGLGSAGPGIAMAA